MISDLAAFEAEHRAQWDALEAMLTRLERDPGAFVSLDDARDLLRLYQQASGALARVSTQAAAPELTEYLEGLVGRAYAEIHETREHPTRFRPLIWFLHTFPATVRRHVRALIVSCVVTFGAAGLGAWFLAADGDAKEALLSSFPHLLGDPSDRVAEERALHAGTGDPLAGRKAQFSGFLMQNNIRVSILAMSLGMTFGLGTALVLFINGLLIGAVCMDYLLAGEGVFLAGWLLPHGSIEIPAILLAGQAGFVLAHALVGWGKGIPTAARMRQIGPDLVTLIGGLAVLLVWAGVVEAFFSQYHEPLLPARVKIGFGAVQLVLLAVFLSLGGRARDPEGGPA